MFLVVATMMFVVVTNNVKYGLHTNIIPQEGYKGTKNRCLWTGPDIPQTNLDLVPDLDWLAGQLPYRPGFKKQLMFPDVTI
jgi:hypothetical protein